MSGPSGADEDRASQQTVQDVAAALAAGRRRSEVIQDLVDQGQDVAEASELVIDVHQAMQEQASQGGGGGFRLPGWVIWIGALVLFNVCSYLFGWGWLLW